MDLSSFLIEKNTFDFLYVLLYFFIAFISIILIIELDFKKKIYINREKFFSIIFICLFILIVGLREYSIGVDTSNYYLYSWEMNIRSDLSTEILFDYIIECFKWLGLTFTHFLFFVAALFYLFLLKAVINFSKNTSSSIFLLLFSYLSFFFVLSMSINIIRQGLSLSLLLFAYSLWLIKKPKLMVIFFLFLSVLTHTTSIIPILIFLIINYGLKKYSIKYFYVLYFIGIALSAVNIGILNIAPFLNELLEGSRRSTYLVGESESFVVGFKPQFVVFNTIFLLIFTYINKSLKINNLKFDYVILLKYYLVTSFLFFMVFQIPYSDRWGLFSWICIPILIAPVYSLSNKLSFRTPIVLFFIFIFIFFQFYD